MIDLCFDLQATVGRFLQERFAVAGQKKSRAISGSALNGGLEQKILF
jgi:hypothetical protein